jgi:hypothetical protein
MGTLLASLRRAVTRTVPAVLPVAETRFIERGATCRTNSAAQFSGAKMSKDMAHRLFRAAGLQPHAANTSLVLCVERRARVRALERSQPCFRRLWYLEGVTHDYVRHGTTTLIAALDVASHGQPCTYEFIGLRIKAITCPWDAVNSTSDKRGGRARRDAALAPQIERVWQANA